MRLDDFNSKYIYKTDKEKHGLSEVWEIPELQDDGFYYGDCESYCLFLQKNIADFKDWDLYYCKLNGEGHCVLYKNKDVIDCNIKAIVSFENFCKIYDIKEFKKYSKITILSKLLVTKLVLLYINILNLKRNVVI